MIIRHGVQLIIFTSSRWKN